MSPMPAVAACSVHASTGSAVGLTGLTINDDVTAIQQRQGGVKSYFCAGGAMIRCICARSSALSSSSSLLSFKRFGKFDGNGWSLLASAGSRWWSVSSPLPLDRQTCAIAAAGGVARSFSRGLSLAPLVPRAHDGKAEAVSEEDEGASAVEGRLITGKCFVVDDNIDTDQIIPAERLTLVPSKPDEYEELGSHAMEGLPARYGTYIEKGSMKTKYPIMIGGRNFGCGSSREHAPVAMGAAGCKVVVAQSFARIYFRNCVATGELYPVETDERVCEELSTGDEVTVDMVNDVLLNHTTGKQYPLKPIGEAGPVIDAGGIFSYARKTGMIAQPTPV